MKPALCLCALGCAAYSPVIVPASDAPSADRRVAYVADEIASMEHGRRAKSPRHPVLGDGRRPQPDELATAVDPASATGQALTRARHDNTIAKYWAALGLAAYVAGAVGSVAEGLELHRDRALAIVPTATTAFALVVLAVLESDFAGERAQRSLAAAYDSYNADLRARLALCTRGLTIVDCESGQ